MKHSIKASLRRGETVHVMSIGAIPNPKLVEIAGLSGLFQGIWIDQEHAFTSHAQMELLLLACRATGLDAFARVPPTDYATIMRPMEAGCSGIMLAQIRTVEQVETAIQWAKYPPTGVRGLFLGNAECRYGQVGAAEQVEAANRDRWIAVQIETAESLEILDAILALDDVDMLFVGPADLSCNLGVPGQVLHDDCRAALQKVAEACQRAGKPWGTLSRSAEHANYCQELGCTLLSIAGDLDLIRRGLESTRTTFLD